MGGDGKLFIVGLLVSNIATQPRLSIENLATS